MIRKFILAEFKEKYSCNEHRSEIHNMFIEDLKCIKSQCKQIRVLVFGSYITKKENPKDIDILISLIPNADNLYCIMKNGLKQNYPDFVDVQFNKTQYWLKETEALLNYFNNNPLNVKKGIRIKDAIEISDI
ncbi:DUF6932 family protein [Spirochaetota bacterium]